MASHIEEIVIAPAQTLTVATGNGIVVPRVIANAGSWPTTFADVGRPST
jgi:hypothetical protein